MDANQAWWKMGLSTFALICSSCLSADLDSRAGGGDLGTFKMIAIDSRDGVKMLRKVLSDWEEIAEAILYFMPDKCIRDGLTIESLSSVTTYSGVRKADYLNRAGLSSYGNESLVFSVGAHVPCLADPYSSDPAWVVAYIDAKYKVVGYARLSE